MAHLHNYNFVRQLQRIQRTSIWKNSHLLQLLFNCYAGAAWEPKCVSFKTGRKDVLVHLNTGQCIFGRYSIAEQVGAKPDATYKRLKRLEKLGEVHIDSNSNYTIVTLCHWHLYDYNQLTKVTSKSQQNHSCKDSIDNTLPKKPNTQSNTYIGNSKGRGKIIGNVSDLIKKYIKVSPQNFQGGDFVKSVIDNMQKDKGLLLSILREKGAEIVSDKKIHCPFHDDKHPSAYIQQYEEGVWRYRCLGGECNIRGNFIDIYARATGRKSNEVFGEISRAILVPQKGKTYRNLTQLHTAVEGIAKRNCQSLESVYPYPEYTLIVYRLREKNGDKTFLTTHRLQNGQYAFKMPEQPWPLYNPPLIWQLQWIVVVEGEKCRDDLMRIGIPATTSPFGAECAKKADWRSLAGKTVYNFPDNDTAGRKYADDVEDALIELIPQPRILRINPLELDLEQGQDVSDLIERYRNAGMKTSAQLGEAIKRDIAKARTTQAMAGVAI